MPSVSFSNPGYYTVNLPVNAYDIFIQVRGARGGNGGRDAGAVGGVGGLTTLQDFTLTQNFIARQIICWVGARGGNGADNLGNAPGGFGGAGLVSGGRGGNAGDPPFSGGGGGGGGASGIIINGVNAICMGGSGGGGGASDNRNGGGSGLAGLAATAVTSVTPTNGGGGGDPGGTDGGGGGGGGGGDNGGGGGGSGQDNNRGGGGGGAGGSTYIGSLVAEFGATVPFQTAGNGFVSLTWDLAPVIDSFTASPNPQTSSSGTPRYDTILSWSAFDYEVLTLTSSIGESWDVTGLFSFDITNLPQSVFDSNSPASRSYTLTATKVGAPTATASTTASAFNDNTPTSVNRLSEAEPFNTNLLELEPNTFYYVTYSISGVDMNTSVIANNNCTISLNAINFGPSRLVQINNLFYVGFTTDGFNQSRTPGGFDDNGRAVGQPNPKVITFTVGTQVVNLNVATKPPIIQELFDAEGQPLSPEAFPNPDIDTVFPNVNTEYVITNSVITNDAQIPVEVKASLPGVQVRVNGGGWQDVREIGTPP